MTESLPPERDKTEPLRLMMVQVDDVTGELLGEFVRRAEALGARNIQIVASLTKKGRPGYLVYIDVPASLEAEIAFMLGSELGAWGYRVLQTEHRHFDIGRVTITLETRIAGESRRFPLRLKTVSDGERLLRVKAEFDDVAAICRALRNDGADVPVMVLKAQVESRFSRDHAEGAILALDL